jgi:hypothetical protein
VVLTLQTRHGSRQRTVYLGQVDHDRAQMARVNGVLVVGLWLGVERVVPFCAQLIPRLGL